MASGSGTLYIGAINNLARRVFEHKEDKIDGFSKKYKCDRLVYYEQCGDVNNAIEREKQMKGWRRNKKECLTGKINPG